MKNIKPKFPIFTFGEDRDNMICAHFNEEVYNIILLSELKSNYYYNHEIIDSEGVIYRVKNVEFVRYYGFWGRCFILGGKRLIVVKFEYQNETGSISLENLKKRLIPIVTADQKIIHYWEEQYEEINKLIKLIEESKTFGELAKLFWDW
jgi:hypothetical protein